MVECEANVESNSLKTSRFDTLIGNNANSLTIVVDCRWLNNGIVL